MRAGVDLRTSAILRDAGHTYPYPSARALRAIQRAQDAREQYAAILKAAETLTVTICACLGALMRARAATPQGRNTIDSQTAGLAALSSALVGRAATFGTWTTWLSTVAGHASDYADLVPTLESHTHDGAHHPGLLDCLNALRDERNRSAHGDSPQSLPECALRADEIGHHLETAVAEAAFLTERPWLLVRSTNYRPDTRTFEVTASLAMGGDPDFDLQHLTLAQPVGTDLFYLLDHGAPILLSPLVTSRFCPACRSLEVCYPVHADTGSGPATMRSFERGHDIEDLQLGVEIRNLAASR